MALCHKHLEGHLPKLNRKMAEETWQPYNEQIILYGLLGAGKVKKFAAMSRTNIWEAL